MRDVLPDQSENSAEFVDVNKCRMYMKNFGEFFNNQIECRHHHPEPDDIAGADR
ncbi:MAG: hypothetical protein ACLUOI_11915 [Eisenbergiella sp.]